MAFLAARPIQFDHSQFLDGVVRPEKDFEFVLAPDLNGASAIVRERHDCVQRRMLRQLVEDRPNASPLFRV